MEGDLPFPPFECEQVKVSTYEQNIPLHIIRRLRDGRSAFEANVLLSVEAILLPCSLKRSKHDCAKKLARVAQIEGDVKEALGTTATQGSNDEASMHHLKAILQNKGYQGISVESSYCIACHHSPSSSFPCPSCNSIRHFFLKAEPSSSGRSTIVETDLRSHFRVPRPTEDYLRLINEVPHIFCADSRTFFALIKFLGKRLADCFHEAGMALPPWRRTKCDLFTRRKPAHFVFLLKEPHSSCRYLLNKWCLVCGGTEHSQRTHRHRLLPDEQRRLR